MSSFSNKLFFDVGSTLIIIQQEPEKQILNQKFYNVSELKNKNTTRQLFTQNFHDASDFQMKKITTC